MAYTAQVDAEKGGGKSEDKNVTLSRKGNNINVATAHNPITTIDFSISKLLCFDYYYRMNRS